MSEKFSDGSMELGGGDRGEPHGHHRRCPFLLRLPSVES